MAKKRVHELAKQYDMPSAEVLKRLAAHGIEVKAAASAVDEDAADRALTGKPPKQQTTGAPQQQRPRPVRPGMPLDQPPDRPRPKRPEGDGTENSTVRKRSSSARCLRAEAAKVFCRIRSAARRPRSTSATTSCGSAEKRFDSATSVPFS